MTRERRCYVCYEKDGSVHLRVFLAPEDTGEPLPRCEKHGTMLRDPNRPYRQSVKA